MTEREIFIAALQRESATERQAFLDEVCAARPGMRDQVLALLKLHEGAGDFLLNPAVESGATGVFLSPAETRTASLRESPGMIIGPYKLLQQIGEGGMGTVFMAQQTEPIQRKVALKIIKAGMDTDQVVARFEAERQALAMMDHVNIARVFDAGATESGRPYFVMELVHGVPITKYCDDNHLTTRERLELFVPVCQAIQHAHQKGIIHRDIKPSNVMITLYDGKPVPKVIDFGVAKATEQNLTERTLFTQYGNIVGTLEYMSPEQAEMSALGVDTRSDIYSLGVLLYELLTGSTPLTRKRIHSAAYVEILRMIKEEEPPKPSTRLNDSGDALASISAQRHTEPAKLTKILRGELDWIVMKTLEKDRNRRYETANGFAADVRRYLNDETVLACPPSALYRFRKFARRNKSVLISASVLAFAMVLGTVGSGWQALRAMAAEVLAESRLFAETEALKSVQTQLQLTEKAEEKAIRRLYDASLAQAKAGSLSRRIGQRFVSLDALAEAIKISNGLENPEKRKLDLRNAAIACLALPDLRLVKQWSDGAAGAYQVDFDDKMEIYARSDSRGAVSIRHVADEMEIASLPATGADVWILMSRDAKFLAVWSATQMKVWKLNGSQPIDLVTLNGDGFFLDFSPDGRYFVYAHRSGPVRIIDLATGKLHREFPGGACTGSVAFCPKLAQIAVGRNSSVEILDLDSGKVIADLPHHPNVSTNCIWHPDGLTLAVLCNDQRVHLWDVAAAKKTHVLSGLSNGGVQINFNHAGDLLATSGWERKLRLWDPRTGQQRFSTALAVAGNVRFTPDDQSLAVVNSVDGKLRMWHIGAGAEYRTMANTSAGVKIPFFSPTVHRDGRLLAVGIHGGVGLWDLASGRELQFLASPGVNFALFEPKGSLLINSPSGLTRWPIRADAVNPAAIQMGPPQRLSVTGSIYDVACSTDGAAIISAQSHGAFLLRMDRPNLPIRLTPHADARYVAASHDGKRVATSSHGEVAIWDVESGKLAKRLPGIAWGVKFSPDGKWLGTVYPTYRLWEVGSWRESRIVGGVGEGADFSPDGKILAVETGNGVIRLVNPDTGIEYASLEDPHQDRAGRLTFSPDGTQLIATNGDSQSIHVWDLRLIREQLAKLGLDWDLPPYPPGRLDRTKSLPIKLDVINQGSKVNEKLWQDLLAGKDDLHRFSETKYDGSLTPANARRMHDVEMKAGKTYVLDMNSKAFDTVLTVTDHEGTNLADNDDITAHNLNSRILFTAPATATYRLIAAAYTAGATGAYVVRIRELVEQK